MALKDRTLAEMIAQAARRRPRGACPDDERLSACMEGRLSEEQSDKLLSHLCRCPSCLSAALTLKAVMKEQERERSVRVPLSALARARRLDPAGQGLMEVVIAFARGAARVLKLSDGVTSPLTPAMEPVRGEGQVLSETLVTLHKQFPPYLLELDIEKTKPDRGEISLKLTDQETGKLPTGMRASLFRDDDELESAALEQGQAVFENLRFGQYRLEIARAGASIGRIALEMKGE